MIRNAVVHGISPTDSPLKSAEEIALEHRALRALNEYRLVKDGVIDYGDMGFALPDGRIIATKLIEYLVIGNAYAAANEAKYKKK
ncbi:MAG: hypothetical protein KAT00_01545 [Planctomycetes bacterium]|nr:hypothetical protein [Planctomycetota bacterium]